MDASTARDRFFPLHVVVGLLSAESSSSNHQRQWLRERNVKFFGICLIKTSSAIGLDFSSCSFLLCLRTHKINIRAFASPSIMPPPLHSACMQSVNFPSSQLGSVAKSSKTPDYLHERRAEENRWIVLVFRNNVVYNGNIKLDHLTLSAPLLFQVALREFDFYMLWVQTMLESIKFTCF